MNTIANSNSAYKLLTAIQGQDKIAETAPHHLKSIDFQKPLMEMPDFDLIVLVSINVVCGTPLQLVLGSLGDEQIQTLQAYLKLMSRGSQPFDTVAKGTLAEAIKELSGFPGVAGVGAHSLIAFHSARLDDFVGVYTEDQRTH